MSSRQYVWLNGDFFRANEPTISLTNRSFLYGDGFFETIHAYGTEPRYIHIHFARIAKSLSLLKIQPPAYLNAEFLSREITRLLNKNRIFGSVQVRVTFYREMGDSYTPVTNTLGIAMQTQPLPNDYYYLNPKGLVVDVFADIRKPINIISSIKSCNAQLYVMAQLFKNELGVDDCLLINDQNRVIEAISSNLFLVANGAIYTPSLDEGCVDGVMRSIVIDLAKTKGYTVNESVSIDPDMVVDADELFLTNAVLGIRWVVGLRQKRYFGTVSRKLSDALNAETFGV